MAVEQLQQSPPQGQAAQQRGTGFPGFSLAVCVVAIKDLMNHGGQATPDHLASYLGYRSTNNGAYLTKVAACRQFALLDRSGPMFVPSPLGQRILHPVYPQDAQAALVDAFLACDLFRRIYEDFKGKELPPEFGMKNALRNIYGVKPERVNDCYRVLMESAEAAGFFTTRAGARTHLIMPLLSQGAQGALVTQEVGHDGFSASASVGGGGGGGGEGGGGPPAPAPTVLLTGGGQASRPGLSPEGYLAILTKALDKGLEDSGTLDEKIMDRIERVLGMKGQQ